MAFSDRYKIAGDITPLKPILNMDGVDVMPEDVRIEIGADAYAIGEMLQFLYDKLEHIRLR